MVRCFSVDISLRSVALIVIFSAPAIALPDESFESPSVLSASLLLPDYLLAGDEFTVEPHVWNDGETNHYRVRSPLGDVEAAGRDELEQSIQELRALALLQDASKKTGAVVGFNQGLKGVVASPYNNVKRVVFNPLYAIQAVPGEIADYAGKFAAVGDLFKYGPYVFVRRSVGIDGARDDLADRLHVEADTENDALRKQINRVGLGVWAGGVVPSLGDGIVDLSLDLSKEVGDFGSGNLGRAVDAIRREVYPRSAWRLLKKLDVPKDVSKSFRDNPNFHGRMRENMATALLTMSDTEGRIDYVAWAEAVQSESEARQVLRLAQVMAVFNALEEPISRIRREEDVLLFETADDDVVALLRYDYLIWSEPASHLVARATAVKADFAPEKSMEIWSAGEVSPRFRDTMSAQGFEVRTNVDEDFPEFERPRKGLKRAEQHYERRIEKPVMDEVRERLPEKNERLVLAPLGPSEK